jgi:hypothetical protein
MAIDANRPTSRDVQVRKALITQTLQVGMLDGSFLLYFQGLMP